MPKRETFDVPTPSGPVSVTVSELGVGQILDNFDDLETALTGEGLVRILRRFWELSVDGMTLDQARACAPSDLLVVWRKFRKVNAVFFGATRIAGLGPVLDRIRAEIVTLFYEALSVSLSGDTPESLTTDGLIS